MLCLVGVLKRQLQRAFSVGCVKLCHITKQSHITYIIPFNLYQCLTITDIENISSTPSDSGVEAEGSWDETSVTDSESSESESEDEFMADGELVRKTSRGFKQISNCRRFWKASLLTG